MWICISDSLENVYRMPDVSLLGMCGYFDITCEQLLLCIANNLLIMFASLLFFFIHSFICFSSLLDSRNEARSGSLQKCSFCFEADYTRGRHTRVI